MKKIYETPVVEKVEFQYQEQVVASPNKCQSSNSYWNWVTPNTAEECNDESTSGKTN